MSQMFMIFFKPLIHLAAVANSSQKFLSSSAVNSNDQILVLDKIKIQRTIETISAHIDSHI